MTGKNSPRESDFTWILFLFTSRPFLHSFAALSNRMRFLVKPHNVRVCLFNQALRRGLAEDDHGMLWARRPAARSCSLVFSPYLYAESLPALGAASCRSTFRRGPLASLAAPAFDASTLSFELLIGEKRENRPAKNSTSLDLRESEFDPLAESDMGWLLAWT